MFISCLSLEKNFRGPEKHSGPIHPVPPTVLTPSHWRISSCLPSVVVHVLKTHPCPAGIYARPSDARLAGVQPPPQSALTYRTLLGSRYTQPTARLSVKRESCCSRDSQLLRSSNRHHELSYPRYPAASTGISKKEGLGSKNVAQASGTKYLSVRFLPYDSWWSSSCYYKTRWCYDTLS